MSSKPAQQKLDGVRPLYGPQMVEAKNEKQKSNQGQTALKTLNMTVRFVTDKQLPHTSSFKSTFKVNKINAEVVRLEAG